MIIKSLLFKMAAASLVLATMASVCSSQTGWTCTYGGSVWETAQTITPTPDGNFILGGTCLMKIKPNGDTVWTKHFEGMDYYNTASAILNTQDRNFFVAGGTSSRGNGSLDIYLLKINQNGDTLWSITYEGPNYYEANAISPTVDGNFIVAGTRVTPITGDREIWILSLIDDKYATKDSLFAFKIPISGDSLDHALTPLKVPSGMSVSMAGLISWTPRTGSVSREHVKILIADDLGHKDTVSFNIYVNSPNRPDKTMNPDVYANNILKSSRIAITSKASNVSFSFPSKTATYGIFDVHGRLLEDLPVSNHTAAWLGKKPCGRYFVRAIAERQCITTPFVLVK